MRKKRNKKFNLAKSMNNMVRGCQLQHIKSWGMYEDGSHHMKIVDKRGLLVKKYGNEGVAKLILEAQRRWLVEVTVYCIDDNGEEYLEQGELETDIECKLNDLYPVFKELLDECIDAVNHKHIYDEGWVVTVL